MRHTLRLATGAREQKAEHGKKGSEVWEVRKRKGRAGERRPEGTSRLREKRRRGRKEGGPGGLHHLRAPANAASQARTGPRLPAGDLPAHRLVGQLAHAIELLLHLGPAAALARELGKDGAARSPPQGYMAPRAEPPGRRRRHCGASGSLLARARLLPEGTAAYSSSHRGACYRILLTRSAAPS